MASSKREGTRISDFIKPSEFIGQRCTYFSQALRNHYIKHEKEKLAPFEAFKTDEERASFVWKLEATHDILELEPEWEQKETEKSTEFRTNGNKYFQKKSYFSASKEYTKSIRYAPPQTEEGKKNELALSYANRSAALFHLKKYDLALLDISQAFNHDYPREMHVKLYERQGKCNAELGKKEAAVDSFTRAIDSLKAAHLGDKGLEKWTTNLESQVNECENITHKAEEESEGGLIPPELGSARENFPNMSSSVSVKHHGSIGRYLIAEEQLDIGRPVIIEMPFCSVLYFDYHETHCYNCFKRVSLGVVPCQQCASVTYCSQACADNNWKKCHQYECKFFELYDLIFCGKIGHLALKMVMQVGLREILEYHSDLGCKSSEEKQKNVLNNPEKVGCNKEGMYPGDYNSVCHLSASIESNFEMAATSCALLKLLQLSGFFQQGNDDLGTEENFCKVAGIICFHLRILQCNGIRITELTKPSDFEEPKPKEMGMGIYPTAALINHACDPNSDYNFYGMGLAVRSSRILFAGEQICCSYGLMYHTDRLSERQKSLKADYNFVCECAACIGKWPVSQLLEDQIPLFRCEECRTPFISYKLEDKKYARCHQCDHRQDLEASMGKLYSSHVSFQQGMAEAMHGKYEEGLVYIKKHLALMQRFLQQPWKDFTSAHVAVRNCYKLMANRVDK